MYEDVCRLCQNVEKVMGMFSEELRILDRNTVQYMIDEMQADIDRKEAELDSNRVLIQNLQQRIAELKKQLGK